jgi:uncharacterized membrane protein YdbT with pleckstrin-like domain
MELHPDEVVVFEGHPSWRATLGFYLLGAVVAAAAGVIVAVAVGAGLGVAVGVVVLALVIVVGLVRRWATDYMVSNQRLYIRHGIMAKHVQQTRVDRIQNVNTDQSIGQRILRVGTVDFDTAGTDDADFRFVGIANPGRVARAVDVALRDLAAGPPQHR